MNKSRLMGSRFGRLLVVAQAPGRRRASGRAVVYWACQCECGAALEVNSNALLTGNTTSCGCFQKEVAAAASHCRKGAKPLKQRSGRRDKWGALRSANYLTYVSWTQMRQRCFDEGCPNYANYGGRGITVCDRWVSFETFLADMGPRQSKTVSLDRIDNSRGYEPWNCRWATPIEQGRNRRGLRWFRLNGQPALLGDVCKAVGLKYSTADMRLRRGWDMFSTFLSP